MWLANVGWRRFEEEKKKLVIIQKNKKSEKSERKKKSTATQTKQAIRCNIRGVKRVESTENKSPMSINSADNRNSTKVSKTSNYLSNEENELVFRLVGRRCVSQCTTVAQLFLTEGPTHSRWIKKHTGALCFIKDNAKRSYFCRMFCLMRHEMVWEQEMYDTVDLSRTRPYLLTFEGQVMPETWSFA